MRVFTDEEFCTGLMVIGVDFTYRDTSSYCEKHLDCDTPEKRIHFFHSYMEFVGINWVKDYKWSCGCDWPGVAIRAPDFENSSLQDIPL